MFTFNIIGSDFVDCRIFKMNQEAIVDKSLKNFAKMQTKMPTRN